MCFCMESLARNSTRRNFLAGHISGEKPPIRPPWACAEGHFLENCSRCGLCIETCPENILVKGSGGYPITIFTHACTFCGACLENCNDDALQSTSASPDTAWKHQAIFGENCLSLNGTACRSCDDSCDNRAIYFQLQLKGRATPLLKNNSCTGCGACISVCPVSAIEMQLLSEGKTHVGI